MSENVVVDIRNGRLDAQCKVCFDGVDAPNKGLGRAVIAAFKTQHQHLEEAK